MRRDYRPLVMWLALGTISSASAGLPVYVQQQLQCRANFGSAFNLPAGTFFTSNSPTLNDADKVAIKLTNVAGSAGQGFWYGGNGSGQIEYVSADDASLGQGDLNNANRLVFEVGFAALNGVFYYDGNTDTSGFLTNQPFGASSWGAAQINDAGQVGYRASFNGPQVWVSYGAAPTLAVHAVEAGYDPNSPYSYLFTPSFNNNRQIAGKVRLGGPGQVGNERPDQVRIFNADGSSTLIARDRDGDPNSPYSSFDNSVSLTNTGWVAFTADLVGGGRAVLLGNGTTTRTIASTVAGQVTTIEFFAPAANDRGVVAFRAIKDGLRGVYLGDGTSLKLVIREHDIVPTDLGDARIDQHDTSPVFGGGPAINRFGDVAYNAALTPPGNNQIEWGSGVFVALATTPGDLNCDGAVDFADIDPFVAALGGEAPYHAAYPDCRWLNADANGDDAVDFADIDPFVALLGG